MSKNKKDRRRRTAESDLFEVAIFVGETVSIASVMVDDEIVGVGEAKRLPGDKWSAETGRNLALGRALQDAAEQLLETHAA